MGRNKKLQEIDLALNSLVVFRKLLTHEVILPLRALLDTESMDPMIQLRQYTEFISRLYARSTNLTEYIFQLICEDDNFYVSYFSLEMPATVVFGKLLSTYIFEKYGKELSIKEILSRKKDYILSDEDYRIVIDSMVWLNKIEKKIHIYDKSLNADKLYAILMQKLEKFGKFTETENRKIYVTNLPPNKALKIEYRGFYYHHQLQWIGSHLCID